MSRYVTDLRSRAAGDPRVVGGKGAGLNRLTRQHFNVPPGFVITTLAFRDFLASLDAEAFCPALEGDGGSSEATRQSLYDAVRTTPIPAPIRDDICREYARRDGRVAVRSSAAGEDASGASHAGQFETVLDVTGTEELLDAVRACWASLFSERAASYQSKHGPADHGGMAVVVQRMAPARAAGVAFTVDPITGEPRIVIEAAPGLGTAVVGGATRTDRYVLDRRGALAQVMTIIEVQPLLPEPEVRALARIVSDIASRAGYPQDVEWAWDGARFHILQARPITTLRGRHVYSRTLVSDMAPGLVKPMVYDVNTLAKVHEVFGTLFDALLGAKAIDTSRLVTRLHSRVYADTTVMAELLQAAGLPPNLFEMMLRDEQTSRPRIRMSPRLLAIALRMFRLVLRTGRLTDQQARQLRDGRRNLEPFKGRDWSTAPLPELLAELDQVTGLRNNLFWFFFCSVFNSAVRTKLLRVWVERRAPGVEFGDLIRGLAGIKSLEPSQQIIRLSEQARDLDAEAQAALLEGDDRKVRELLNATERGRTLAQGVDGFLAHHGYLSSNGSDFSCPSWAENPALIWRSIARSATSPSSGQETAAAVREAACGRVRASVGPFNRWIFARLMTSATTSIDWRERASLLISEYTYQMRRLFLAAGQRLVEQGRLAEPEGLFYLTRDELHRLAAGRLEPEEAATCIEERRTAMAADAAIDAPEVVVCIPGQPAARAAPAALGENLAYLNGIGGSPGLARGFARVIHDPADAPLTLGRTDILVVPFSDVGWTPLFAGIGGIVAETGGQLSHAAIVAREYNLPAVVSVRDATRRICDGQALTVDGSQGRVYLESAAA